MCSLLCEVNGRDNARIEWRFWKCVLQRSRSRGADVWGQPWSCLFTGALWGVHAQQNQHCLIQQSEIIRSVCGVLCSCPTKQGNTLTLPSGLTCYWQENTTSQRFCRFCYFYILIYYKNHSAKAFSVLMCIVSFSQKLLQSQPQERVSKPVALPPSQWLLQQTAVAQLYPPGQREGFVCGHGWRAELGNAFSFVGRRQQSCPGRNGAGADGALGLRVRLEHGHQRGRRRLRAHGADKLLWKWETNRNQRLTKTQQLWKKICLLPVQYLHSRHGTIWRSTFEIFFVTVSVQPPCVRTHERRTVTAHLYKLESLATHVLWLSSINI